MAPYKTQKTIVMFILISHREGIPSVNNFITFRLLFLTKISPHAIAVKRMPHIVKYRKKNYNRTARLERAINAKSPADTIRKISMGFFCGIANRSSFD